MERNWRRGRVFTGRLVAATAVAEAVTAEIEIFLGGHAAHFEGFGDHLVDAILHLLDFFLSSEKVSGDLVLEEVVAQLLARPLTTEQGEPV